MEDVQPKLKPMPPDRAGSWDDGAGARTVTVLAVLLAAILVLRALPIWTIGLYQDDAVISGYSSDALLRGKSLWGYFVDLTENMVRFQGRIAPVFALGMMPLQASLEDNLFLYRVIQGAGQLFALGCFALLIRAITRDIFAALLCAMIYVVVFEVRDYHDASHAIFILMPYLVAVGSLSCLFALRSNESDAPYGMRLWTVFALNAAGILMYEMAVPLSALSCLILLGGGKFPWRTRLARAVLAGFPVLVVIAAGMVAKAMISSYEGTMVGSMSPAVVGKAYLKHLSAAVPLSYWWFDAHGLLGGLLRGTRANPGALLSAGAIALAVGSVAFLALIRTKAKVSVMLVVAGATLLFLPSLMVSVSLKYQREAVVGVGYLQNALSYLGTSILAFSALAFLCQAAGRRGGRLLLACAFAGSVALGWVGAVTLLSSYRVAVAINETWRHPREQMEVWMEATRPSGTQQVLIAIDRDWLNRWEWPPFLFQHWGVRGKFATLKEFEAGGRQRVPGDAGVVELRPPGKSHPASLSLFVDSSLAGGRERIRAIVMSTSRETLTQSALRLARGTQLWLFADPVKRGRHGYFYREVVIPVSSAGVRDFSLVVSPPAAVLPQASPGGDSSTGAAVEWTRGRFDDGWVADKFEFRAARGDQARLRLTLFNASGKARTYVIEGAGPDIRGALQGGTRAAHTVELAPGGSIRGSVSPAFVPRDEGLGLDDRSLGLRVEVDAAAPVGQP